MNFHRVSNLIRPKHHLFSAPTLLKTYKKRSNSDLGFRWLNNMRSILGLPLLVGKNKKNTFWDIKERLAKKLAGWKEKLLSKAGKEVLIKAVVQAIPTYSMSCFKIPDSLCDEMTSLIRNIWWGQCSEERKMDWIS